MFKSSKGQNGTQKILDCIPHLKRYAYSLIRDADHAEDLLQDSLQRAFEKIHLWKPDNNIRSWLFTIMHNIHASQARRYHNGPKFVNDDAALDNHSGSSCSKDMEIRDLQNALATLSPDHREIIHLICVEELKYEEVAAILDLPKGTVMSRLYRAREQLRAFMFDGSDGIDGNTPHLRRIK